MTLSSCQIAIDRLSQWLKRSGVKIHWTGDLPDMINGMYRSETREIFVDDRMEDHQQILMTLAHEAGHWIGWERSLNRRDPYASHLRREREAMVLGWRVLEMMGGRWAISRQQWIAFHQVPDYDKDVDTSMVKSR